MSRLDAVQVIVPFVPTAGRDAGEGADRIGNRGRDERGVGGYGIGELHVMRGRRPFVRGDDLKAERRSGCGAVEPRIESMERSADAVEVAAMPVVTVLELLEVSGSDVAEVIVAVLLIEPEGALGDVFTEMVKLGLCFKLECRGGTGDGSAGSDRWHRAVEERRSMR